MNSRIKNDLKNKNENQSLIGFELNSVFIFKPCFETVQNVFFVRESPGMQTVLNCFSVIYIQYDVYQFEL